MPTAIKSCQNILFRDIFDARSIVIFGIVGIYYAVDLVLCLAQPILLKVVKDDFGFGFTARHKTAVGDCNGQRASQHASKMCDWMSQLILLIASVCQIDKYAQVVSSWCDSYTGTCEFGAQLIETPRADTFHGTVDKECGYRRMMRSLLSDIRYPDLLVLGVDMMCNGFFVRLAEYWWSVIFDFPIALMTRSLAAEV